MTYNDAAPLRPINNNDDEYHYVKGDTNSNIYDAIGDTTVFDDNAIYSLVDDSATDTDSNNGVYSVAGNSTYLTSTGTDDGEYSHLNRVI